MARQSKEKRHQGRKKGRTVEGKASNEQLERQEGELLPKREAMSAIRPPGWQFENQPVVLFPDDPVRPDDSIPQT